MQHCNIPIIQVIIVSQIRLYFDHYHLQVIPTNWHSIWHWHILWHHLELCMAHIIHWHSIPIGSMVLLYMVCHGFHQYTPFMLAYIAAPWIRHGDGCASQSAGRSPQLKRHMKYPWRSWRDPKTKRSKWETMISDLGISYVFHMYFICETKQQK